jgi:hypothetical protein
VPFLIKINLYLHHQAKLLEKKHTQTKQLTYNYTYYN